MVFQVLRNEEKRECCGGRGSKTFKKARQEEDHIVPREKKETRTITVFAAQSCVLLPEFLVGILEASADGGCKENALLFMTLRTLHLTANQIYHQLP